MHGEGLVIGWIMDNIPSQINVQIDTLATELRWHRIQSAAFLTPSDKGWRPSNMPALTWDVLANWRPDRSHRIWIATTIRASRVLSTLDRQYARDAAAVMVTHEHRRPHLRDHVYQCLWTWNVQWPTILVFPQCWEFKLKWFDVDYTCDLCNVADVAAIVRRVHDEWCGHCRTNPQKKERQICMGGPENAAEDSTFEKQPAGPSAGARITCSSH